MSALAAELTWMDLGDRRLDRRARHQAVRVVAGLGGFLNRKRDGFPAPRTLSIGLQRAADFVLALDAQRSIGDTYG